MAVITGIKFRTPGKVYYFAPGELRPKYNDHVIVETARGLEYGRVVLPIRDVPEEEQKEKGLKILEFDELLEEFYDTKKDLLFIVEIKNGGETGYAAADIIDRTLTERFPDYKGNLSSGPSTRRSRRICRKTIRLCCAGHRLPALRNLSLPSCCGSICSRRRTSPACRSR